MLFSFVVILTYSLRLSIYNISSRKILTLFLPTLKNINFLSGAANVVGFVTVYPLC